MEKTALFPVSIFTFENFCLFSIILLFACKQQIVFWGVHLKALHCFLEKHCRIHYRLSQSFQCFLYFCLQHFSSIVHELSENGYTFSKVQVMQKFRSLKSRYLAVRDNNNRSGKYKSYENCIIHYDSMFIIVNDMSFIVGRGTLRFIWFDLMHGYFRDSDTTTAEFSGVDSR